MQKLPAIAVGLSFHSVSFNFLYFKVLLMYLELYAGPFSTYNRILKTWVAFKKYLFK